MEGMMLQCMMTCGVSGATYDEGFVSLGEGF